MSKRNPNHVNWIRPLGAFEEAAAMTAELSAFNIVVKLEINASLTVPQLQQIFTSLSETHGLLHCGIKKRESDYWFFKIPPSNFPIEAVSNTSLDGIIQEALNTQLPAKSAWLWKCQFMSSEQSGKSILVFSSHHSIMDAACLLALIKDFSDTLNAINHGATINPVPSPILDATETRFPEEFKGPSMFFRLLKWVGAQLLGDVQYRFWPPKCASRAKISKGVCVPHSLTLGQEETSRLLTVSRQHQITFYAVLEAAMLIAVNRVLFQNQTRKHRYVSFHDLRPFLKPPIHPTSLGAHISMGRFDQTIFPEHDFWELARSIQNQIYDFGKKGHKFISNRMTPFLIKWFIKKKTERMASTALSYIGFIPDSDPFHKASIITDLSAFISSNTFAPYFTAGSRIFHQQLTFDFVHLDSDMDLDTAKRVSTEIESVLKELIDNHVE